MKKALVKKQETISLRDRAGQVHIIDKIKRYGWELVDKPGEFMMIPKEDLYIDETNYQRSKRASKKITDMSANWSWARCGVLIVAIRNDLWWVVDGGHRKLAADRRSDIKLMPCLVFDFDNEIAKEAKVFVDISDSRTGVGSCDRFKALITAKEESAIGLRALLRR